jgi:hypothetical protein
VTRAGGWARWLRRGEERAGEHREGDPPVPGGPGENLVLVQPDQARRPEVLLDGLITNGKFCCVRRVRLSLTWWRRPLGLRRSALHTDVALVGEPDDPDLDRLPPARPRQDGERRWDQACQLLARLAVQGGLPGLTLIAEEDADASGGVCAGAGHPPGPGAGIEQQLDRLRAAPAERGWELDDQHVYRNDGYSGARHAPAPGVRQVMRAAITR